MVMDSVCFHVCVCVCFMILRLSVFMSIAYAERIAAQAQRRAWCTVRIRWGSVGCPGAVGRFGAWRLVVVARIAAGAAYRLEGLGLDRANNRGVASPRVGLGHRSRVSSIRGLF